MNTLNDGTSCPLIQAHLHYLYYVILNKDIHECKCLDVYPGVGDLQTRFKKLGTPFENLDSFDIEPSEVDLSSRSKLGYKKQYCTMEDLPKYDTIFLCESIEHNDPNNVISFITSASLFSKYIVVTSPIYMMYQRSVHEDNKDMDTHVSFWSPASFLPLCGLYSITSSGVGVYLINSLMISRVGLSYVPSRLTYDQAIKEYPPGVNYFQGEQVFIPEYSILRHSLFV